MRLRIHREFLDGARQIARQRAHQQAAVFAVVADARHHVGAAEALRILERGVGDLLAGFQVEQAQHDRGGAQVHRDAVDRPRGARDLRAVDQDALAIARHRRVRAPLRGPAAGRTRGARCACWPRRIVWQRTCARRLRRQRLAGEPEIAAAGAAPPRCAPRAAPCPRPPRRCTPCTCPACGRKWEPRMPIPSAQSKSEVPVGGLRSSVR